MRQLEWLIYNPQLRGSALLVSLSPRKLQAENHLEAQFTEIEIFPTIGGVENVVTECRARITLAQVLFSLPLRISFAGFA